VAWIITVFASSYQYTQESYLIDLLWERFMIWGWREFFRFVLALFNVHREELIELTYDKAMHFLGNIARSDILKCGRQ
jgi:VanZ family protein